MTKPDLPEPARRDNVCRPMNYRSQRENYYDIPAQLDALWHDIDQGLFGDHARQGGFYRQVLMIKQAIPKDTPNP